MRGIQVFPEDQMCIQNMRGTFENHFWLKWSPPSLPGRRERVLYTIGGKSVGENLWIFLRFCWDSLWYLLGFAVVSAGCLWQGFCMGAL